MGHSSSKAIQQQFRASKSVSHYYWSIIVITTSKFGKIMYFKIHIYGIVLILSGVYAYPYTLYGRP